MADDKRTATPADATKRTTTKPEATDVVMPVTDPIDLWYLCEKVTYANANPLSRADGVVMYQRVVTQLIRLDCDFFNYAFPYAGEVGYDMTQAPPAPIMSRKESHRPSQFPLSQYRAIKEGFLQKPFAPWLEVDKELLSLGELEEGLTPEDRADQPRPFQGGKGMFRIPDVIRMINFTLSGKPQFSQPNIYNVIEIKFAGDRLREEQVRDYRKIAGNRNNFRLLQTNMCDGSERRTREWVRAAAKEPVYMPVGKAMERAARRRNGMAIIPEYELLVDAIDREHQEVRRVITPGGDLPKKAPPWRCSVDPPKEETTTYLSAGPSVEEEARRRRENERRVAGLELTLMAPFVVAAGATIAIGAPIVLGGGSAAEPLIIARTGAKVIPFARVLRPVAAATGAAATVEKLAAQPADPPQQEQTVYALPTTYVYWPD
jgi:hypothetical protein